MRINQIFMRLRYERSYAAKEMFCVVKLLLTKKTPCFPVRFSNDCIAVCRICTRVMSVDYA